MYITDEQTANYHRDGYILVPGLFTCLEVEAMLNEVESDRRVASHTRGNEDAGGKKARLAIWHELGDDLWAAASTNPRIANVDREENLRAASLPCQRRRCHTSQITKVTHQ